MFPLCMYGEECTSKQLPDSTLELSGNWFNQLSQCNFRINDPRIKYPRFVNFCRTVYNWGDTTFNRYDSAYVIGTGQNWKLYANSYNWHQSYAFIFHDQPVILHSKINSDLGISLNFMAVSIGYTWNVNRLITGKRDQRRIFNFSFTCALFSAEITSWNTYGDTKLTKFGNYKNVDGSNPDIPIDNMNHKAFNLNAYYFFNHNKYSQAAAYNFSKYQLKSAGSWILGINYGRHTFLPTFTRIRILFLFQFQRVVWHTPNFSITSFLVSRTSCAALTIAGRSSALAASIVCFISSTRSASLTLTVTSVTPLLINSKRFVIGKYNVADC